MRPPRGIGRVKGALRIDVRLTIIERKGKDLMEWIELSAAHWVKKGDKTNPDQWLRQWDNHLSGHCAESSGLDLTKLSHTMNRTGQCGCVWGVVWPQWPVAVELCAPHQLIWSHQADASFSRMKQVQRRNNSWTKAWRLFWGIKIQWMKQQHDEITLLILCSII